MRKDELDRIEKAANEVGEWSIDYHLGAVAAGMDEADRLAKTLGVEDNTTMHSRMCQYAALVWQFKKLLEETGTDK